MKFYIYLLTLFISASALCSDIDCTGKWHSWDEIPEKGQLYMIPASEYAFDRDYQATYIFQIWGSGDPCLCHERGWFEADEELFLQLTRLGSRVIFLPNGRADLPYLNLECKYLHTPREVNEMRSSLSEHKEETTNSPIITDPSSPTSSP